MSGNNKGDNKMTRDDEGYVWEKWLREALKKGKI